MRELLRVDQPLDRLVERHASRDEDGKNDDKPGELLRSERANEERDPKRHRRQRIPEVVDEVSEERDRARMANRGREVGLLLEQTQESHDLDGILRLEHQRVAERVRVILTGRTHHREAAGRHHLEANQSERLVAGVREHRVARDVHELEQVVLDVAGHVDHVRVRLRTQNPREPCRLIGRFHVGHVQAVAARVHHHLRPVRLAAAAHEEADAAAALLQVRHRGDSHQPPLVRVEAADLEAQVVR